MELVLGVLWLAGIMWAGKKAAEEIGREYRKSRAKKAGKGKLSSRQRGRHAAAWWTREARHGFPVTRAGFERGWLAHQTAMDQRRAQREEARTSHLEARASVLSELRAHRKRQAAAQARIDQATAPPTRRADGQPETDADRRFFDLRESGYLGPIDQDGRAVMSPVDANGQPRPLIAPHGHDPSDELPPRIPTGAPQPSTPTGGTPMATPNGSGDINYTQALTQAQQVAQEADDAIHDIRWQQMENTVDQLGAMLSADPASLSDANDVAEALREQKKAMEHTRDAAETFARNLQMRHGGIKEAVDDAPVRAAERPFYEE